MNRLASFAAVLMAVITVTLATASAQPPEGGPPHDPLRAALDADGDRALSPEEIKNAATSVAKLDHNGDGRIDHEEFRPPRPPRRPGPPDGEGLPGGRPPRDFGGPPREFDGPPRGERPEGREPREGRRPPGAGDRPQGGPDRPSPERFVERAMAFDADGDGKLDKAEMEKFAGEMRQRMRGGPGGPPDRGDRPRPPEPE